MKTFVFSNCVYCMSFIRLLESRCVQITFGLYWSSESWVFGFQNLEAMGAGRVNIATAVAGVSTLANTEAVTADGRYQCRLCGRVFTERNNLHRHLRIHTGFKPYRCPHCSYQSNRNGNLIRHMEFKHGRPQWDVYLLIHFYLFPKKCREKDKLLSCHFSWWAVQWVVCCWITNTRRVSALLYIFTE